MYRIFGLFLSILQVQKGICLQNCKPNVAVIGGGIGGASASHFLQELFENNINIDLYEAKAIGGRLATVEIDEKEYEAGGAVVHTRNKYMQNFIKLLGLEYREKSDQRAGIWDGNEFPFEESNWMIISLAKLLFKYGIQPFSLSRYVNSILNDFEKIYDLQDAGKSFTNISDLLKAMNPEFPVLLQIPIKSHLLDLGYKENLIDDLVKATLAVNYGQDASIQSFVGFVSIAGAGSELWSVKGGNKKVPEHLIYRNGNINVVPSYVKKIRNITGVDGRNLYEIDYSNKDSNITIKSRYDIVILATPLTLDQKFPITFEGFPENDFHHQGKYHETIATFVKADLRPKYFDLDEELDIILSCDPNRTIINSIGRVIPVEGPNKNSRVWKIFSNAPLKKGFVHEMFSNIDDFTEIIWKAYPEYSSNIHTGNFKLHDTLYHVNVIEWAASAMEMSAIGGRNVAILSYKDFTKNCYPKESEKEYTKLTKDTPSKEL